MATLANPCVAVASPSLISAATDAARTSAGVWSALRGRSGPVAGAVDCARAQGVQSSVARLSAVCGDQNHQEYLKIFKL